MCQLQIQSQKGRLQVRAIGNGGEEQCSRLLLRLRLPLGSQGEGMRLLKLLWQMYYSGKRKGLG